MWPGQWQAIWPIYPSTCTFRKVLYNHLWIFPQLNHLRNMTREVCDDHNSILQWKIFRSYFNAPFCGAVVNRIKCGFWEATVLDPVCWLSARTYNVPAMMKGFRNCLPSDNESVTLLSWSMIRVLFCLAILLLLLCVVCSL